MKSVIMGQNYDKGGVISNLDKYGISDNPTCYSKIPPRPDCVFRSFSKRQRNPVDHIPYKSLKECILYIFLINSLSGKCWMNS